MAPPTLALRGCIPLAPVDPYTLPGDWMMVGRQLEPVLPKGGEIDQQIGCVGEPATELSSSIQHGGNLWGGTDGIRNLQEFLHLRQGELSG
jgi:hypothetical protein